MDRSPFHCARRGFTVTELLVVMAVIALLAALLFPVLKSAGAKAKSAQCLGNLRSLGTALNVYLGEHDMKMPELAAGRESKAEEKPVIDTVLLPYVKDARVFACPADRSVAADTGTSYFYNSALAGQPMASLNLLGLTEAHSRIPVLLDKEGWHKGGEHATNHLFADGHAGNEWKLIAE